MLEVQVDEELNEMHFISEAESAAMIDHDIAFAAAKEALIAACSEGAAKPSRDHRPRLVGLEPLYSECSRVCGPQGRVLQAGKYRSGVMR